MTNKIEDLKRETAEYLEINSIDVDYIIDHLSQNDRWKAFLGDDVVVVPREPRQKMIDAAMDAEPKIPDMPVMRIYKAMIAARGE
jgi:hypothetical protein